MRINFNKVNIGVAGAGQVSTKQVRNNSMQCGRECITKEKLEMLSDGDLGIEQEDFTAKWYYQVATWVLSWEWRANSPFRVGSGLSKYKDHMGESDRQLYEKSWHHGLKWKSWILGKHIGSKEKHTFSLEWV